VLLVGVTAAAIAVARAQEEELRRDVLRTNLYAARAVAGTVLFELRGLAARVEAAAADPELARMLEDGPCRDHAGVEPRLAEYGAGTAFDSLSLFDASGAVVRRWPAPKSEGYAFCSDFSWRDYVLGARALGERGRRGAYLGRTIRSKADAEWKFSLSAPVYDARGRLLGVIDATLGTDSALGQLRLRDSQDPRRTAVLVAPQDRDCAECPLPQGHLILLHDRLEHGEAIHVDSAPLRAIDAAISQELRLDPFHLAPEDLALSEDDHHDPLDPDVRWLAGYAPVGQTGYVVTVMTRHDAAVGPNATLARRLGWVGAIAAAAGAAMVTALLWLNRRRRRHAGL
jgi:hypothetical protein